METSWFLEGLAVDGSRLTHALHTLPYTVGRDPACQLVVEAQGLSRRHAEFRGDGDRLLLADLGSTNGTFVNREPVKGEVPVYDGDVIHFGHAEYRLGADTRTRVAAASASGQRTRLFAPGEELPEHFVRLERQLRSLLAGEGISGAVQPIVDAADSRTMAFELLGRGAHAELPVSPMPLFHFAKVLGLEAELSDAFRRHGVQAMAPRLRGRQLFVNTHPKETFSEAFFQSLCALKSQPGAPEIVVEIHENAAVELTQMRNLAARLRDIGVPFAYDDFGAGESRIVELTAVPAHVVKFDMALIRGLDVAPAATQKVVRGLVEAVTDVGSMPLAEGVETEAEAAICRELGFRLFQGYLTGRPQPFDTVDGA